MGRSQGKNKKVKNARQTRKLILGKNSSEKVLGSLKNNQEQLGMETIAIFKEFQRKAVSRSRSWVLGRDIINLLKDIDISGKNIFGIAFNGINFQNVNASKAKFFKKGNEEVKPAFQDLEIRDSNFEGSEFSKPETNPGVDFDRVVVQRTNFKKSFLLSAKINQSQFFKTDFSEANLTKSDIENTFFVASNLTQTNLSKSVLTGMEYSSSGQKKEMFSRECILDKTNLNSCKIKRISFNNNSLNQVDLNDSDIKNCEFVEVDFQDVSMSESFITETSFNPKDGSEIDMSYSEISHTEFAPFSKIKLNLENVLAEEVKFSKVDFRESNFQGSVFRDCNFYGADLSQVRNIENAVFIDCNLDQSKMPSEVLSGLIELKIESEFE